MSFKRRRSHGAGGGGHGGHGDDLTITPLLDLMVALIPFLIFGTVMTRINIVDVGVSRPVAQVTQNKKDPFNLLVQVSKSSALIQLNGRQVSSIPFQDERQWTEAVRKVLVDIKKKNPDQFQIRIEPKGTDVTLQTLMLFMDAARKLKPEDGDIIHKDESGQTIKLQYLFPNVVLRGVYS